MDHVQEDREYCETHSEQYIAGDDCSKCPESSKRHPAEKALMAVIGKLTEENRGLNLEIYELKQRMATIDDDWIKAIKCLNR